MSGDRLRALFQRVNNGPIRSDWRWLRDSFAFGPDGIHLFGPLTLAALDAVDQFMPGYAGEMLRRLEQLGGREKDPGHYAQILQWLAELVVIHHLARHPWSADVRFIMEPTAGTSRKNPEVLIELQGVGSLGVEVKSPNLESHRVVRRENPWQVVARGPMPPGALGGKVTLPKDNAVKDFLVSADAKFVGFRETSEDFRSVLVIVWDDYINEPLSALRSPTSGLLTPRSFHRGEDGHAVT